VRPRVQYQCPNNRCTRALTVMQNFPQSYTSHMKKTLTHVNHRRGELDTFDTSTCSFLFISNFLIFSRYQPVTSIHLVLTPHVTDVISPQSLNNRQLFLTLIISYYSLDLFPLPMYITGPRIYRMDLRA